MILIPVCERSHLDYLEDIAFLPSEKVVIAILFEGLVPSALISKLNSKCSVEFIAFESLSSALNQTKISEKSVNIISRIKCSGFYGEKFTTFSNMLSLHIHPVVNILSMIELLITENKYSEVITFGCKRGGVNYPERTDVKTLYHSELSLTPIIVEYLKKEGLPVKVINIKSGVVVKFQNSLRRMLLNGYKFYVVLRRKIYQARMNNSLGDKASELNNVAVIIRAQSEYWTVKPLLEALKADGLNPVIVQDDLIKNPSCKKTLDEDGASYISIHSGMSISSMVFTWIKASYLFIFSQQKISKLVSVDVARDNIEKTILDKKFLSTWMNSTLHSLPELAVFETELLGLNKIYDFKCFITMDMVDQWSAIIGKLGRELGTKTLILQNTVLDDIIYPRPIATDFIAVSGSHTRTLLKKSNCSDNRILNFGLPIHDDIYKRYQQHSGKLNSQFRIVLATQPFVQDYDYNKNLILDLLEILNACTTKVTLILKPHPREEISSYRKLVKGLVCKGNITILVNESDNILLLAENCDLFISRTSTAIQSFILLGRVCVSYLNQYPVEICDRLDYLGSDACIKTFDKKDFKGCIENLLQNFDVVFEQFSINREMYIDEYIGDFDGGSSTKLSRFIKG